MLEGDDYRFDIRCHEQSTLMFAPQANTRVFPCPGGTVTRQSVRGTVYADGLVVCGGDPIVPYRDSRFSQTQSWTLYPGARLVLLDWMIAGRLDRGEGFAFDSYENETRIETPDGRPLLTDAVKLKGDGHAVEGAPIIEGDSWARPGMGGFASAMTLHVLGPGWESIHAPLEQQLRAGGVDGKPFWMEHGRLAGLGVREGRGFSLRALGVDRAALEPLASTVFEALARPDWLGFDFWSRKY
jgi:urease accessory protein